MSYLGMVISHAYGTGCTRRESLMCLFAVGLISKHVISKLCTANKKEASSYLYDQKYSNTEKT